MPNRKKNDNNEEVNESADEFIYGVAEWLVERIESMKRNIVMTGV